MSVFAGEYFANCESKPNFIVDVLQTEDGLPQNSVISMMQSRNGYLWVGTLNGLARFDGLRFTVFDENNAAGLSDSRIVSLFEDKSSNIWISTEAAGVFLARPDKLIKIDIGGSNRFSRVVSICEDDDGAVWHYTADGQLARYKDKRVDVWNYEYGFPSNVRLIIPGEDGGIIVATDRRLSVIGSITNVASKELPLLRTQTFRKLDSIFQSKKGGYWVLADSKIRRYKESQIEEDFGVYQWNPALPITAAREADNGKLIIGTLGAGIFIINNPSNSIHLTTENGLSHNYILSLIVDREGTLWVGTDGGGLNRIKQSFFNVMPESLGMTAQSICEDLKGNLWFGFNAIDPMSCVVGRFFDGKLQVFNLTNGLFNSSVRSVFCDNKNNLWVGTWGGLFKFAGSRFQFIGQESLVGVVQAIFQDRKQTLWFGTRQGLARYDGKNWKIYRTADGLSSDNVLAINEDSHGNLWIGMARGGINKLTNNIVGKNHSNIDLPGNTVNSICIIDKDVIVAGTSGGIAIYSNRWFKITNVNGLPCNNIGFIIEDKKGNLWLGSSAGLLRVSKKEIYEFLNGNTKTVYFRIYGKADGLPTGECSFGSQPSACLARDGILWFPTIKGLISVNPEEQKLNLNPPPVVIESVVLDGEPVFTNSICLIQPETITVSPSKQWIHIQFASLNLCAPERARFKYKLTGLDKSWNDGSNSRIVRYNKLPPGEYKFNVIACNEDGIWNESGASINLIIQPPFYRTWWFIISCAIFVIGSITITVHRISTRKLQFQLEKLKQKEMLERERSRIARDLHDQLGANLTQIALVAELIEGDKEFPEEIESYAQQIKQTARETTRMLDEIVWAVNPANDTVESLANYICKYAQDYLASAGIRFRNEIPASLPDIQLLPEARHNLFLATKEAITNIARHSKAKEATLKIEIKDDKFIIELCDDGIGFAGFDAVASKKRSGVLNMQKRLHDIGGEFYINKLEQGGTVVKLVYPLKAA